MLAPSLCTGSGSPFTPKSACSSSKMDFAWSLSPCMKTITTLPSNVLAPNVPTPMSVTPSPSMSPSDDTEVPNPLGILPSDGMPFWPELSLVKLSAFPDGLTRNRSTAEIDYCVTANRSGREEFSCSPGSITAMSAPRATWPPTLETSGWPSGTSSTTDFVVPFGRRNTV